MGMAEQDITRRQVSGFLASLVGMEQVMEKMAKAYGKYDPCCHRGWDSSMCWKGFLESRGVGGLTDKPITAAPTSIGYGTNLCGLTPLSAMLNSCVPGIAVMNLDNGFGAGCLAHKISILSS